MQPKIVVTEGLETEPMTWLKTNANVVEVSWKEKRRLAAALKDADGLIVRTYTLVNEGLLAAGTETESGGARGGGAGQY